MDRNRMGRENRDHDRQGYENQDRMRPEDRFGQQGLDHNRRQSDRMGDQQYGYGQQDGYGNDWQRGAGSFGRDERFSGSQQYGNQDRWGQNRGWMDSGNGYGSRQDSWSGQSGWGDRSDSRSGMGDRQGSNGQHAGKGPKGYQRDPQRILEEVNERLTSHPDLDASEIEVRCENGEVTLTGTVTDRQQKRLAEECAEGVSGIKDVHNQIRVQAQSQQLTATSVNGNQATQPTGRQGRSNDSRQ